MARLVLLLLLLPTLGRAASVLDVPLSRLIAAAPAGSVVRVTSGIHHVNRLRIDKPMTLIGQPGAVLDGGSIGDVLRIGASDVTVRDLIIRHSGLDLTTMNAGIFVEQKAKRVSIEYNVVEQVLFGVYLDGSTGTRVIGNRIRGIRSLRPQDRGDGIHLWNDVNAEIRNNDIGWTRDGIYMYISPHSEIVGNRIHDVRYGVHYMYSNHDRLADNRTDRTVAGYALMQSSHLIVNGNRSEHDASYGILLNYVTYSNIVGNVVRGVTGEKGVNGMVILGGEGKGMFVYNSEFNHFVGNQIIDCPIGIHVTAGSENNRFYDNAFVGNRIQVKYVQNVAQEWSWRGQGNYWSDYLGWDLDGDGRGDTAYRPNDSVDILLWKYPQARLLMNSPAILALRYAQRAFPVFTLPSVKDSHPLMHMPKPISGTNYAQHH